MTLNRCPYCRLSLLAAKWDGRARGEASRWHRGSGGTCYVRMSSLTDLPEVVGVVIGVDTHVEYPLWGGCVRSFQTFSRC